MNITNVFTLMGGFYKTDYLILIKQMLYIGMPKLVISKIVQIIEDPMDIVANYPNLR